MRTKLALATFFLVLTPSPKPKPKRWTPTTPPR